MQNSKKLEELHSKIYIEVSGIQSGAKNFNIDIEENHITISDIWICCDYDESVDLDEPDAEKTCWDILNIMDNDFPQEDYHYLFKGRYSDDGREFAIQFNIDDEDMVKLQ